MLHSLRSVCGLQCLEVLLLLHVCQSFVIVISVKVMFYPTFVHLSLILSIAVTLCKNYSTDLHENFTSDVCVCMRQNW